MPTAGNILQWIVVTLLGVAIVMVGSAGMSFATAFRNFVHSFADSRSVNPTVSVPPGSVTSTSLPAYAPRRDLWRHLLEPRDDPDRAERLRLWLVERLPDGGAAGASGEAASEASEAGGEPVHRPAAWTQSELADAADVSDGTFRAIREAAGVEPSGAGSAGQTRAYTPDELHKMIEAAPQRAPKAGAEAAAKWRKLLSAE